MKHWIVLLVVLLFVLLLLSPGVWWGDSLNAYIQGIVGQYGSAQPPLLALLCNISRFFVSGSILLFSICVSLFYFGLYLMATSSIRDKRFSYLLFFLFGFWPILLANIAVIQTEAIQLGLLSSYIPLVIIFSKYNGRYRWMFFLLLTVMLLLFSLLRYDSLPVTILLAYWQAYSFYKQHKRKTVLLTLSLLIVLYVFKGGVESSVGIEKGARIAMSNSLLVTDIAAISALSQHNYIPEYCWQDYLPNSERNIEKVHYGLKNWGNSFYSYIYNIDPSVGLFKYDIGDRDSDLKQKWLTVVFNHPLLYLRFHSTSFFYFLSNDNFNMGFWSGLKDAKATKTQIAIEKTAMVDSFLEKHSNRFSYSNGSIVLYNDEYPINSTEELDLLSLVPTRRKADVQWMKWYSSIPASIYVNEHRLSNKYIDPFFEKFKNRDRSLSFLGFYFFSLIFLFAFFRKSIQDSYLRFSFFILCFCGIIHIGERFIFITDPVYRFGIISVLFLFQAILLLVGQLLSKQKENAHS